MKNKNKKKTSKKKSFYFEDYTESEILVNNSTLKTAKTSLNRVTFLSFIFFSLIIIFSIKIIYLSLSPEKSFFSKNIKQDHFKKRRDIVDKNGSVLATNVILYDVGVRPQLLNEKEKKNLQINLSLLLPELDSNKIRKKINSNEFFWLDKRLTPKEKDQLWLIGSKAFEFESRPSRIYPQKNLFSHILGQIDNDNNGISGLEKSLNENLRSSRDSIKLTVDKDIQFLIRKELLKYQEIFKSKGSAAILMDVNNGNILSLVSLPDFNPNERKNISDVNYINRVTKGTYELGSVFKVFTFASALNEKLIEPDTEFLDLPKSIKCDRYRIGEYDNEIPSDLTAEQILVRSGNIGSVRIAQKVGPEKFKSFLEDIGVLTQINFDIEEVAPQIDYDFGKCRLATASFGHGVATTILQLAKGYAILANGGYDVKPTLVFKEDNKKNNNKRIINKGISEQVVNALRKIVNTEEGTARFADVQNYEIGGKTGTADQPEGGKYSEAKINTFSSVFPTSNPQFVFVVMLDTPKKSKDYYYKYRHRKGGWKGTLYNTAGWTSVEVAGKVIDKIGPILATKYIQVY